MEDKYMDIKGERRGGRSWEFGTDVSIVLILCIK